MKIEICSDTALTFIVVAIAVASAFTLIATSYTTGSVKRECYKAWAAGASASMPATQLPSCLRP